MRVIKSQKPIFNPINPQHCEHVATYYSLMREQFHNEHRDVCLDIYSPEFDLGYVLYMLAELYTGLARGELYLD